MKRRLTICFAAIAVCSCGPNERIMNSAAENRSEQLRAANTISNSAPAPRTFEQDLNAMRTADFSFIYVFRRKDGGVLDADDKSFITRTTPSEINRRALADEGRALILGSNFRLPDDNLKLFKERFSFEDHSKPESEIMDSTSNR
jgi:hypothetical protein